MAEVKRSAQRELLLDILHGTKSHPDADWIYQRARRIMPRISLGTVYRNLAKLADEGIISRIKISGRSEHFDGDVSEHYHFVCSECGGIRDIPAEYNSSLNGMVDSETGQVTGHKLIFFGVCANCDKK